jgi:glycerophosphoryl diester phosphodiesterase
MQRSSSERLALVLLAAITLAACTTEKGYGKKNPDFLVIGHRGAPHEAAENTIPAFDAAMDLGAGGIETDLCVTSDREIVVWHDRNPDDTVAVARQAGLEGLAYVPVVPSGSLHRPVDQLTLAEFRDSHGYAPTGGARDPAIAIPLLADLLAWAAAEPDLRALYLDIKLAPSQTDLATFLFAALITAWDAEPRLASLTTYVICPHRPIVEAMIAERDRAATDHFRIVWDFETAGSLAGATALSLRDVSTGITPIRTESEYFDEIEELVAARKKGDLDTITAWTIDREMQMFRILYYGVDAALTNEPGRLHDYWQDTLN